MFLSLHTSILPYFSRWLPVGRSRLTVCYRMSVRMLRMSVEPSSCHACAFSVLVFPTLSQMYTLDRHSEKNWMDVSEQLVTSCTSQKCQQLTQHDIKYILSCPIYSVLQCADGCCTSSP